jgi:Skp family chaperone for outer membrane proteins
MNRIPIFRVAVALGLACLLLPLDAAAKEAKPLAVVDSERIVQEYGAARDAQAQYQKFLQGLEQDISDREKDLQRAAEAIESQRMLLGEDALRAKMQEFETQKADYYRFRQGLESRAESEYKAKIQPIIDQVKLIAERIGKEQGYGIIVDAASLTTLYIDADIDLTDEVLQALVSGTNK